MTIHSQANAKYFSLEYHESYFYSSLFDFQQVDLPKEKSLTLDYCHRLEKKFRRYRWKIPACRSVPWKYYSKTASKNPLPYIELGRGKNTVLIISGIHPDEINPIPIAFRLAKYISQRPHYFDHHKIIIAPLVNPDGFFKRYPSRVNHRKVDLNRNFETNDWAMKSKLFWQQKTKNNPRTYPGEYAGSEIETRFCMDLIARFKPQKVISIHAPLGFLDYDGPGDRSQELSDKERSAKQLVYSMSSKTKNYKVVDYNFYPGSLGNYAGNDRKIPTITLEFKSTDPSKFEHYWNYFLPGLIAAIEHDVYKKLSQKKPSLTNKKT